MIVNCVGTNRRTQRWPPRGTRDTLKERPIVLAPLDLPRAGITSISTVWLSENLGPPRDSILRTLSGDRKQGEKDDHVLFGDPHSIKDTHRLGFVANNIAIGSGFNPFRTTLYSVPFFFFLFVGGS